MTKPVSQDRTEQAFIGTICRSRMTCLDAMAVEILQGKPLLNNRSGVQRILRPDNMVPSPASYSMTGAVYPMRFAAKERIRLLVLLGHSLCSFPYKTFALFQPPIVRLGTPVPADATLSMQQSNLS